MAIFKHIILACALALAACAGTDPDPFEGWGYSHTVSGTGCAAVRTTRPADLRLQCDDAPTLTEACPGDAPAHVWTREGATFTPGAWAFVTVEGCP